MNARQVSLLVPFLVLGVGFFAIGVDRVRTEPDDNSDLEAVPVRSDDQRHQQFLAHELEEGVSVEAAMVVYLAKHAAGSDGFALSRWRPVDFDKAAGFVLTWTSNLEDEENRKRVVFQFDGSADEVAAKSESAKEIVRQAGKLAGKGPWAVHPTSYVPQPEEGEPHWKGRARKVCASPTFEHNCRTLEAFFQKRRGVRVGLGWVVRTFVDNREQFDRLRHDGECTWKVVDRLKHVQQDWPTHRIKYECAGEQFQWNFGRDNVRLSALDEMAHLLAQTQSFQSDSGADGQPEMIAVDLEEVREAIKSAVGNAKMGRGEGTPSKSDD